MLAKLYLMQGELDNLLRLAIHGQVEHIYVGIFVSYFLDDVTDSLSTLTAFIWY